MPKHIYLGCLKQLGQNETRNNLLAIHLRSYELLILCTQSGKRDFFFSKLFHLVAYVQNNFLKPRLDMCKRLNVFYVVIPIQIQSLNSRILTFLKSLWNVWWPVICLCKSFTMQKRSFFYQISLISKPI